MTAIDALDSPSYRLPAAAHIGLVRLKVADLERSIGYYETVIGLRLLGRDAGVARLAAHGDDRVLLELHEQRGARAVPRRGQIGLYHFAILLPSRAALGAFVRHLSEIGARAGMADHLVSEAVYLTDPDGLGIEVYADRPRTDWRTENGELVMRTDPLDVPALVAAADAPWSGAPAGTTIGHVHLYVRDIAAAEAFYHRALGFDRVVWSYPGALFMSAGGYHHHLGTNIWAAGAPLAGEEDARLLEWELVVPEANDVDHVARSLEAAGYAIERRGPAVIVRDPWGTPLRIVAEHDAGGTHG
jgi:catechol 2,3-dioxygenase